MMADTGVPAWWGCDLVVATSSLSFSPSSFTLPTPLAASITHTIAPYPHNNTTEYTLDPLFALQQLLYAGTWPLFDSLQNGETHMPHDQPSFLYRKANGSESVHVTKPHPTVGDLLDQVPESSLPPIFDEDVVPTVRLQKSVGGMPFIKRLRSLLANPKKYSDSLVWDQECKSIIVAVTSHRFLNDVLPKAFGHSNIASFNRQLNVYGFSRVATASLHEKLDIDRMSCTAIYNGWYHKDFNGDTNDWIWMTPRPSRARAGKKLVKEMENAVERERLRKGVL